MQVSSYKSLCTFDLLYAYVQSVFGMLNDHTGQMRPIIQLECAAVWSIQSDSDYYGDPQIIRKNSF